MKWLGLFLSSIWLAAGTLSSAAQQKPWKSAWDYYDDCPSGSFVKMVECGKRARNTACTQANMCSPVGNSVVRYADNLANSVRRSEMTESQAERQWIEFKLQMEARVRQEAAAAAAAEAASAPRFCLFGGSSATCY